MRYIEDRYFNRHRIHPILAAVISRDVVDIDEVIAVFDQLSGVKDHRSRRVSSLSVCEA